MNITTQDLNDFINKLKELREEMEGIALEAYKKGFLEGWNSCFKMYGSGKTIEEGELSKYKTITELLSKCADMCKKERGKDEVQEVHLQPPLIWGQCDLSAEGGAKHD